MEVVLSSGLGLGWEELERGAGSSPSLRSLGPIPKGLREPHPLVRLPPRTPDAQVESEIGKS
jgi:hypothetical protein